MVHSLGLALKTGASVEKVQRIRYGPLLPEHALLHKHWRIEYILENMHLCRKLLSDVEHKPQISKSQEEELIPLPSPELQRISYILGIFKYMYRCPYKFSVISTYI